MCLCALYVKPAVANHRSLPCISQQAQLPQRLGNDLLLLHPSAVQLAADHHRKIRLDLKMFQNLFDKDGRLAGCHRQRTPLRTQLRQKLRHSRVDFVFVQSHRRKTLPIFFHRLLCLLFTHLIKLLKALLQRRSDEGRQPVGIRLDDSKGFQRILHAFGDAHLRVGNGSVQIK